MYCFMEFVFNPPCLLSPSAHIKNCVTMICNIIGKVCLPNRIHSLVFCITSVCYSLMFTFQDTSVSPQQVSMSYRWFTNIILVQCITYSDIHCCHSTVRLYLLVCPSSVRDRNQSNTEAKHKNRNRAT